MVVFSFKSLEDMTPGVLSLLICIQSASQTSIGTFQITYLLKSNPKYGCVWRTHNIGSYFYLIQPSSSLSWVYSNTTNSFLEVSIDVLP